MNKSIIPMLALGCISVLTVVVSLQFFGDTDSPDFYATWLAGDFFAQGRFDQIYPADTTHYTMRVPDAWPAYVVAQGHDGEIFPFIYPPLWAWVSAQMATIASYETVHTIARIVNPLLVVGMVALAWRAAQTTMAVWKFTLIGVVIIVGTNIGSIALLQDQPQILVSFLIVLAIERSRNGGPVVAGAVLALAAALKLYPAAFAIYWIFTGQKRALASFIVIGGALGGLSIAVAGWPLHAVFLHQLALISDGVLISPLSYSLDPTLANLFARDHLEFIPSLSSTHTTNEDVGWYVMQKPAIWAMLGKIAMLAALIIAGWHHRRTQGSIESWVIGMTGFALLNPLAWTYHYLAVVAFAPLLLERLGPRVALRIYAICFIPLMLGLGRHIAKLIPEIEFLQVVGFVAFVVYFMAWLNVTRRQLRGDFATQ